MRSCIKYATSVIVAAMLSCNVYADVNIHCDYDKEIVSVAGKTQFEGDYYNFSVSPCESESVILMSGKTDSSKKYEYNFVFSEYDTGKYLLRTGTKYDNEEVYFSYVKNSDAANLAALLNAADTEKDVEILFDDPINRVVLNSDAYNYPALENKSKLYRRILAEKPFCDGDEKTNMMTQRLSMIGHIWAFGQCKNSADAQEFAENNADNMGISALKSFDTINNSYFADGFKGKWYEAARKIEKNTVADFLSEYNRQYVLLALKNLTKSEYAADFLRDIGEDIDYDGFTKLSDSDKSVVGAYVTFTSDFATIDDAVAAFNEKVAQCSKKTDNSQSSSSSGGSGGSGGAYSSGSSGNFAVISGNVEKQDDASSEFTDMSGYEWAADAVNQLKIWGVIDGVGNNSFAPARNVTREEFIKLIVSAFDIETGDTDFSYSDVNENEWYYSYVKAAYYNKIVNGMSKEHFGIGEYISRQDAACMIFRVLNNKGISLSVGECGFTDSADISEYAYDSVSALWKKGLINGVGDGKFCPGNSLTRAEAAQLIYNICEALDR